MPSQDLLGYVLCLAAVFLPGLGLGELLGVWKVESSLVERVGMALGIGLAVDTVALFVRTSGLTLLGHRLTGMEPADVYALAAAGALLLCLSVGVRRRLSFYVRPRRVDGVVLCLMLALGAMMAAYFSKYPIFPEYQSEDFANHVLYTTGLISGTSVSIPTGILYYGAEYQLASALLVVGGDPLVTLRHTMALLVFLSPLLVYLGASTLFGKRAPALLATAVYVFSGTLWFDSVFNSGLYANFFGLLACLFLVAAFVDVGAGGSPVRWAVYVTALLLAFLSHYSTLTILPALLVGALLLFASDRKAGRGYLAPAIVPLLPSAALVVVFPQYVQDILSAAEGGGGALSGSTAISAALSSLPSLSYVALEIYDDLAFVVLLGLAAVFSYKAVRARRWLLLVLPAWVVVVLVSSPQDVDAWRFSFMAILPLVLMAGMGVFYLLPEAPRTTKRRSKMGGPRIGDWSLAPTAVSLVFLLLIVVGSWGTSMLSDSFGGTGVNSTAQNDVYQAIEWLGNHTAGNASYLSVSDWRFTYTDIIIGRASYYQFESTPGEAIVQAQADGAGYIIVTDLVTAAVPPEPSYLPWNNFKPSSNLTLVFNNPDVEVFQLA